MSTPKKIFIKTFGCQMNEYDSSRMADLMQAADGMTPTENPEEADVILINTCSVREHAEERAYSWVGELKRAKQDNPEEAKNLLRKALSGEPFTERQEAETELARLEGQ